MQKLLSLDSKDFFTGIAEGAHSPNTGIFHEADGISPFNVASANSANFGLLQAGPTPQSFSGEADNIWAYEVDGATAKAYYLGDAGHFYEHAGAASLTDLRSGTPISSPAKGTVIFQPRGGTKYLYYFQLTQIGRWDLSGTHPTGWTDNHFTGLSSTTLHKPHRFFDEVFYTNTNKIGKIYDNAGTAANSVNVLDFPNDYTAVDLTDDGFYLVAAITTAVSGNAGINKVIFWDTHSTSWNREWIVPDEYISNVVYNDGIVYIFGRSKLWACTFNSPPQFVKFISRPPQGFPYATTSIRNLLFWGDISGRINYYGRWTTSVPRALFRPFTGMSSVGVACVARSAVGTFNDNIIASLISGSEAAYFEITGTAGTSRSAETIYFDFGTKAIVQRIDIMFGEPLTGSDSLDVDVQADEDASAQDWGTYAVSSTGNNRRQFKTGYIEAEQLKLILNFNAGNPKIKRIEVYGEYPSFV